VSAKPPQIIQLGGSFLIATSRASGVMASNPPGGVLMSIRSSSRAVSTAGSRTSYEPMRRETELSGELIDFSVPLVSNYECFLRLQFEFDREV